MSAYAPNPTSSTPTSEPGYASLSAGLLARKGEAMPSVDADAHAGVDIDMRPMTPSSKPANEGVRQSHFKMPSNGTMGEPVGSNRPALLPPASGETHSDEREKSGAGPSMPPENWTLAASKRPRLKRRSSLRAVDNSPHQRKATVTFRMAAKEFVRMRFAARELDMSCQTLILEAVECYLEANDVELVTDEICDKEVNRLMRKKQKKPIRQKPASLID